MNGLQTSLWGGCCPKFYASPHLTPLIGSKWFHPNASTLQCHIDLSVEYFFPSHMGQILQNWENLWFSSIYEMMNMTEVILHFQPGRLKGKRNVNCQALETWPRYVSNAGWSFWIAVKVHQMMNLTFFKPGIKCNGKGRMAAPNRMKFRKNSKQPSTPLIFGKLCCNFLIMDMVQYMQGGTRAR